MANFGFWNVDGLRKFDMSERQLPQIATELALERSLDLLFLIECGVPVEPIPTSPEEGLEFFAVACGDRFKVLVRFDPQFMCRLAPPVPSDRFDLWHLKLPLQEDVLIGVVHGLDKRNNSQQRQELFLRQFVAGLEYHEGKAGHNRSIVLGDFNANPYEAPMASALGMNAVMSRTIAQGPARRLLNSSYPFFYNPMWNLYGDEPRASAPATYFYRGSDPTEMYWHMLDQVLIRPSLIERFQVGALEIITAIRGRELTRASGIPDRSRFSDHLPVVFGVDLSKPDG